MKPLKSNELRNLWIEFFKSKNHAIIGSSSIIPENDPTVLFTTAGMHPLVPYLLGQPHPAGNRLANVQKCIRTGDIDEVGDCSHCTFFEMLGNWSLGDYFKQDMIKWSYEFLTSEKYLGIDKNSLAVSVFAGDSDAERDEESARLWNECGIDKSRIFFLPKENNWWGPAGVTGPCGPDTEMFIDFKHPCSKDCSPACGCGNYLEIWNDVFMQYNKTADGKFVPLSKKNVDTGMGLERTICILQGKKSVYETDIFIPVINKIEQLSGKKYGDSAEETKSIRIIADHIRTSVFMTGEVNGIVCSNVDQGYVLRRLLRRAIRYAKKLSVESGKLSEIASLIVEQYKDIYPELLNNRDKILSEINREEERFEKTILNGLKEFDKLTSYLVGDTISGKAAFKLYDTYGFPIEMTEELAREKGLKVNIEGFMTAFKEHQEKSHAGAEQKFKGGLSDDSEITTRLHSATHLLHKALKIVLNDENVNQKGSNINSERLRFDFTFNRPMTAEEIKETENLVNEAINADAEITCREMTVEEAKKEGAVGLFSSKYGEKVKVYTMGRFSKEICGGPHANRTGELGKFTILKEQSSSAGVRRIKAVLIV